MYFVKTTDETYILNHNQYVRGCYKNTCHGTISGDTRVDFAFKKEYFNVDSPYVATNDQRHGLRKRKLPMNQEEIEEQKYHDARTLNLKEKLETSQVILKDITTNKQDAEPVNVERVCGKCSAIFRDLCFRRSNNKLKDVIELHQEIATHLDLKNIAGRVVKYSGHEPRTICIEGDYYLLPQECTFLLSDASELDPLMNYASEMGGFDVIVVDPPWENKSAKRGKKYSWMSLGDIGKIPLKKFARNGCIIAVWVTNKQKVHRFVKNELFPLNEIQFIAEWHWIKITNKGQPVMEFTSSHKRPYETIIIGCYRCAEVPNIPPSALISVPCSIHSHKPPLDDLIFNFVTTKEPQCLELFARNLKPCWTSWGNEVLDLQNIKHFESFEEKC